MVLVYFLVAGAALLTTIKLFFYLRSQDEITALDIVSAPFVIALAAIGFPITWMIFIASGMIALVGWLESKVIWSKYDE